jgi:imidazolonepropionase-like amidohydrolase
MPFVSARDLFPQLTFPAWLVIAGLTVFAQSTPIAFVGARVIPIDGEEIQNGVVVVNEGRIVSVSSPGAAGIPANARRIDVTGKVLMPGLVDSHSHVGQPEGADASSPFQPDVRVLDSVNPRAASIKRARAGGITTVNVMPGSGHLLSGQTLYLKLREARVIDDLLIRMPDGSYAGGIKMANGTNPRRATPFPGTRGKAAAIVREQYIKAQEYRAKVRAAGNDATKLPPRDLRMEALVEALDGKRIVQHHTHRHDDILTVVRLAEEFNLKVVLHHVSDGWMVAKEVAASKQVLGASVIVIDSPGGKLEAKDASMDTAGVMDKAGVLVGFHTDDGVTDSRWFIRSAALGVRAGMDRKKALEAVTIANARLLALESRVGSLTPGKDADLLILSGDPLSVYTHIEQTWVEGKKVWDRSVATDRMFAVGGPGAAADGTLMSLDECGGFSLLQTGRMQ